ncbi:type IVB secretion system protein IcmH/DotU [Vibrio alginolyticus]|uniref:type IVB secretion system protein IcmH/DotU n=1 Tax=Vibrio alginolyticus TaxID=663 RepID=UPI000AFF2BF7|nr:type IVB secretion system protein IcmH/DotU [Vibrio alginolyticus]MBY7710578.1 type IVB secretion system protein IcmH/DotU [Vibrio alginolyticus]
MNEDMNTPPFGAEHTATPSKPTAGNSFYRFRPDGLNVFIDAATPLMGLALRLKGMPERPTSVNKLYQQVSEEIRSIDVTLVEAKVEPAIANAFRYVLCSFLDEAVLATKWGAESEWVGQSLLSQFHNETWGGEKVFSILARLETDPQRYLPLLMFIYQCLMLGFVGKYRVIDGGAAQREQVIQHLKSLIESVSPDMEAAAVTRTERIASKEEAIKRQWPIWSVFAGFFALWVGLFMIYSTLLSHKSTDVLSQLNQLLS